MNSILSITSLYETVKNDVIKNIKIFWILFASNVAIVLIVSLIKFLFDINLEILVAILSLILHVGLLNFIYALKVKRISLSVRDFFAQITVRKVVRLATLYFLFGMLFSFVFLLFGAPIAMVFYTLSPSSIALFLMGIASILLVLSFIFFFVRFSMIAPFIIFEPHITVIQAIKEAYSRTKTYGLRMTMIFLFVTFAMLFGAFLILLPVTIGLNLPMVNLLKGGYPVSLFALAFTQRGFVLLINSLLILLAYGVDIFGSVVFQFINREIYKRLSKNNDIEVLSHS